MGTNPPHRGSWSKGDPRAVAAVNARWAKYRAGQTVEKHRKEVDAYFAEKGIEPHEANPNVFLAATMADSKISIELRIAAAAKLQPYYNGAPPKQQEPEAAADNADPEIVAKRKQAYDFVLGLIQNATKDGEDIQELPLFNQGETELPEADNPDVELVPEGDEMRPRPTPLSTEIIEQEAEE